MKCVRLIFLLVIYFTVIFSVFADKNPGGHNKKTNDTQNTKRDVTAGCVPGATSTELDINNVRALIHTGGDMWWNLQGKPGYEIPKGSGKTSLFAGSIWIGGVDLNGQLKLAAIRFRQVGVDYWPGPLITSGQDQATVTHDVCIEYDEHFKITKQEVETFRDWYNADEQTQEEEYPGYTVPDIITNWPAHGDLSNGYPYYLAPFYDVNNDDYYDPADGDYPYYDLDMELPCPTDEYVLRGDQTLWWVFNDKGNAHTETGGDAIGLEIHAQAFAFSTNNELNNMTFYNYRIINRSVYVLYDTYFGIWTDADMGYAYDDYIGSDVNRGLGYLYNGEAVDGNGQINAYGGQNPPPPAIGLDFFEGPYQDPDGLDNPSSYDPVTGELICDANIMNGNINGQNFGDGIIDNERWGMRRFIYFNGFGGGSPSAMTQPQIAPHYYNYLKGIWKDTTSLCYGGIGYNSVGGTTDIPSDYMFPGDSDPCAWGTGGVNVLDTYGPWTEEIENNEPYDRRFVQSAGPFTLEPGEVNDITLGVVWARAHYGDQHTSVEEMKRADDIAQLHFDNCFKVIDGPHAPELTIIELDQKLIFHIWNDPASNNYLEEYEKNDPYIVCPIFMDDCDKSYNFQGYQIFQVKGDITSIDDLTDPDIARLVFQCDISDDISQIINYEWDKELNTNISVEKVNGSNNGIVHSFKIEKDLFAEGDDQLINGHNYHYIAVAYAHNDYLHYDQNDAMTYNGQKSPYLSGLTDPDGNINIYPATPRDFNDCYILPEYENSPVITQIEGHGNGDNILDLTQETIEEIMSGEPWKASQLTYERGYAPIQIKVIDPFNIHDGDYTIKFDSVNYYVAKGYIRESKWYIYNSSGDTVFSDKWICKNTGSEYINICNEQLIPEWGFSVTIAQVEYPGRDREDGGYLGSSLTYLDSTKQWLYFLPDLEGADPQNWIRSGTFEDPNYPQWDDNKSSSFIDPDEIYENVLNGTWSPYTLCSHEKYGFAYDKGHSLIDYKKQRLSSIDLVITSDKDNWTRCPVVEMCENDTDYSDPYDPEVIPGPSGIWKYDLRNAPSVDKNGLNQNDDGCNVDEATMNGTQVYTQEDYDNGYIDDESLIGMSYTMGWFPGYAIDVETGERLNIMFGEDSWLTSENGSDMLWNPTENLYSDLYLSTNGEEGEVLFGGKHAIYIMGHNNWHFTSYTNDTLPLYDYGNFIYNGMKYYDHTNMDKTKQYIYRNAMWVGVPFTNPDHELLACDITIRLRISNPYYVGVNGVMESPDPQNENKPMYSFNMSSIYDDPLPDPEELTLLNAYPNPANRYIVIKFRLPENALSGTLSIYDINGRLMYSEDMEKPQECAFIYVNNYSPGVYLYSLLTDNGERKTKKLVIAR